jgi:hypothetical protein
MVSGLLKKPAQSRNNVIPAYAGIQYVFDSTSITFWTLAPGLPHPGAASAGVTDRFSANC